MSTVRMCDFEGPDGFCCIVFSERTTGWSTGTITVMDDDGNRHTEQADFCPQHTPKKKERPYNTTVKMLMPAKDIPVDSHDWTRE